MSGPFEMGAVFDCNVFAQALINPRGPAGDCIRSAQLGKFRLYVSEFVIQEIWELPSKLPDRFGITPQGVERFLQDVGRYAVPVRSVPTAFTYERDPEDAAYINLALITGAQYLVTRDNDLLSLMNTATPIGAAFCSQFRELRIINPIAFLAEMK